MKVILHREKQKYPDGFYNQDMIIINLFKTRFI